jgi:hypothetical protein
VFQYSETKTVVCGKKLPMLGGFGIEKQTNDGGLDGWRDGGKEGGMDGEIEGWMSG